MSLWKLLCWIVLLFSLYIPVSYVHRKHGGWLLHPGEQDRWCRGYLERSPGWWTCYFFKLFWNFWVLFPSTWQEATEHAVLTWARRVQIWLQPKGPEEFERKAEGSEIETFFFGGWWYLWVLLYYCFHLKLLVDLPISLVRSWLRKTPLGFKTCSASPASWHGSNPEWRCSSGRTRRSCPRSWKCGSLGALDDGWINKNRNTPAAMKLRCQSTVVFKFRTTT